LGKQNSRDNPHKKKITFYLDECFPYNIAYALKSFGHPITSWHEEFQGQQGLKDPYLIPYLGGKSYIWITKDDEAKKEHENEIRTAGISVVWVRGLEREKGKPKKNYITVKDLHRMLTDKLDYIAEKILNSKTALYFLLYMKSGGIPTAHKITLEKFFGKLK
jgi:hypothetical protein